MAMLVITRGYINLQTPLFSSTNGNLGHLCHLDQIKMIKLHGKKKLQETGSLAEPSFISKNKIKLSTKVEHLSSWLTQLNSHLNKLTIIYQLEDVIFKDI